MTTNSVARKLPSADWLAFGVGVVCLFLSYVYGPLMLVTLFAVFVPSVLREVGLLRDGDEWTVKIMHRAGFHALLVTAFMIFLGYLAPSLGWHAPPGNLTTGPDIVFGGETLRKAVVWVFLISYLLQYWGARLGSFRILLGVGIMNLTPIVGFARMPEGNQTSATTFILVALGAAALFVGLAFLARQFPRPGGWILLVLCLAACTFMGYQARDPRATWGVLAVIFQVLLILGVTGVALVREEART